jgi:Leucine-rich repeat (LRR) protein
MVKLDVEGQAIDNLGDYIKTFTHIRYLNLSKNFLQNIYDIIYLPNLIEIDVSKNQITDITFLN